jgi:hypothetical protein
MPKQVRGLLATSHQKSFAYLGRSICDCSRSDSREAVESPVACTGSLGLTYGRTIIQPMLLCLAWRDENV